MREWEIDSNEGIFLITEHNTNEYLVHFQNDDYEWEVNLTREPVENPDLDGMIEEAKEIIEGEEHNGLFNR